MTPSFNMYFLQGGQPAKVQLPDPEQDLLRAGGRQGPYPSEVEVPHGLYTDRVRRAGHYAPPPGTQGKDSANELLSFGMVLWAVGLIDTDCP